MKDRIFDKNVVTKAIYGSITILAVLLTMEEHPPTAWIAAATLFGTILVALAEGYSELIAEIIAGQKRLNRQEIKSIWHHTRPILTLANIPTLVTLLSGVGLYSLSIALVVAKYTIYIALSVYGLQVGHLSHGSKWLWFTRFSCTKRSRLTSHF